MEEGQIEFTRIFTDFRAKIHLYLIRMVGEAEAEDLTQEVFLKASRAMKNFRGESKPSTWLYRIATNDALDKLRSPSFHRILEEDVPDVPIDVDVTGEVEKDPWTGEKMLTAEQQVFRKEMEECFLGLVDRLPGSYRTVFVLSDLIGLSNAEITDILEITLETVKIRLHRARARLREAVLTHCDSDWFEGNKFVPDMRGVMGELQRTV